MKKIIKLIILGILIVICFFLLRTNFGFKDLLSVLLPILSFLFGYVLAKKEEKIISDEEIMKTAKDNFSRVFK